MTQNERVIAAFRRTDPCAVCKGVRWMIVSLDGDPGNLDVQRCDGCSNGLLTDADARWMMLAGVRDQWSKKNVEAILASRSPREAVDRAAAMGVAWGCLLGVLLSVAVGWLR